MQRPTGVTILAILAAIGGILLLCPSLAAIGLGGLVGGVVGSQFGVAAGAATGGLVAILGVVALVLAVLELAFAYGAWGLKPWAWTLGVAAEIISIVLTLIRLVSFRGSLGGEIINLAIAAIILYYLMTPEVKRAFGRS
jgi:uncharacterized membrane protein (DUF2068 family)